MALKDARVKRVNGQSSISGASGWMFILSFLLTLLLGWVPFVGPFIGPVVGGYVGGRRAGTAGRALGAAILPAALLSVAIVGLGALAAGYSQLPVIGAIAVLVAGLTGVMLIAHSALLIGAALIGGAMQQLERT